MVKMDEERKERIVNFLVGKFIKEVQMIARCDRKEAIERIKKAINVEERRWKKRDNDDKETTL